MKKIFRNIVISFISVCSFLNFVNGDVYLTDREVGDEPEFVEFINQHLEQELSLERFPSNINWQMPGCAVFFPKDNTDPQKVYVAKKRKHNTNIAKNNPNTTDGHVLHYSSNMHTERQLAIVALENEHQRIYERELPSAKYVSAVPAQFGHLRPGAVVPFCRTSHNYPNIITNGVNTDIKGTLCIYTESPPCRNNAIDNHNYPCIAYYKQLAVAFPNVKFRIFFHDFSSITAKSGAKDYINLPLLFDELVSLIRLDQITQGFKIKCCLNDAQNQKILEVPLCSIPPAELMGEKWNATGDEQKALADVAKIMNQYLQLKALQQEKSRLFNRLYNTTGINNIQYICITNSNAI
ncbi:MAG: hypothetical protein E7015_01430 [Alphaproteobacteria bacterium]|nr:hypothetical protein [Alphaproteobacteria bacterium]